jgi:hypothetical protein
MFAMDRDELRSKVADVVARPAEYVELGIDVAQRYRDSFDRDSVARSLLGVAAALRLNNSAGIPGLPPYHVWPAKQVF